MDLRLTPVSFSAIEGAVRRHLATLPGEIDSFVEDHILESTHYRIDIGGAAAGFASIHAGSLVTQFALAEAHQRYGQVAFGQVRRSESVQAALVPTTDGFFLAHALDEYRRIEKQAFLFNAGSEPTEPIAAVWALRPAQANDLALIRQQAGDFFGRVERHLAADRLFVTTRGGEPVGFGHLVESVLYDDVASVGMFTIEEFRRIGVGSVTVALLVETCRRRGLRPVAGCWYYNHGSKRALERAGMVSPARLLRIEF